MFLTGDSNPQPRLADSTVFTNVSIDARGRAERMQEEVAQDEYLRNWASQVLLADQAAQDAARSVSCMRQD